MRKLYLRFTLLLALLYSVSGLGQDFSNKGKDFWVAYGYHQQMTASGGGGTQNMVLYFSAEVTANVTIDIPGLGYTQNLVVPANTTVASNIIPKTTPDARLIGASTAPEDKGIHIVSDKPIIAYAHIYNASVSGSCILFPTNTLGNEYYSVNFTNNSNTGGSNCYFYVIATDPGTTSVEITPSATAIGHAAGVTFTVNLQQGQAYQVMGTYSGSSGTDLTGSKIKSVNTGGGCKKIAVYSGSGRIAISCSGGTPSSDNYMVQAVPRSAWGKKYLTTPIVSYSSVNGNTASPSTVTFYRVCVSDPTTVVRINGVVTGLPLLSNFYYQIPATSFPQLIEADKPIIVAQYFPSQADGACGTPSGDGDPEVIYLSPVEQSISKVLWNASARYQINQSKHYINVVIPNGGTALSSFTLDGLPVAASQFVVHPQEPAYSYARLNVSSQPGFPTANTGLPHIIQSDSGFNAIAYGYGAAESYGYNAGTNIKDIFQFVSVQNQFATVNFPATCRNTPFYFSMTFPYQPSSITWQFAPLFPNFNMPDPTLYFTGTIVVGGKTLYQYRIPSPYTITAAGTYPIRVIATNPTPDGCGGIQEIDYELQVVEPPLADFTFNTPGCAAELVQFNDNSNTAGRAVTSRYWNFGDNGTSAINNPTHQYLAPGTYNVKYSLITDIGCIADTAIHAVVIAPDPTATITGGITVCAGNPSLVPVTFTAAGGTAPYTFSYNINGGPTQTLATSGSSMSNFINVPTTTAGTYRVNLLQVKNTGSTVCFKDYTNTYVDVIVNSNAVVNLTSATGTTSQAVCRNTAITNIVYTIGSGGTGGSVSGLPAGVTGVYNSANGQLTISGTPNDVPATYTYTLTTTGPCNPGTATGTITINPDAAINLSSASGTNAQSVCTNAAITNITYNVTGGGTNATVTGLPTGVTGTFSGGVVTITGTPTVTGTFNYTITTTGTCLQTTATGSITVNANPTLNLSSAASTTNQTICESSAITNIVYTIGSGGTGANVSGLPSGVSSVFTNGTFTISGTPTTTGTFNYTITVVGPCSPPSLTGTITINAGAAMSLSSAAGTNNQQLCRSATITPITYNISGGASGASVTGLPAGVTGSLNAGVFTILGTPTASGTFNYTVTTSGNCGQLSATGTITVNDLPTANFNYSAPNCENRQINFTDISVPNSGVVNSWTWNFGDLTNSNVQNPSHNYAAAGSYTVTLSVTTDKGCTSSTPASKTVTVNVNPRAGFIVPQACLTDLVTFTDTSSVASGTITSWQWLYGDPASGSNTSTGQQGSHTFSTTGNFTVRQVVFSNTGCSDTVQHTIFINGSPTADFTIANQNALCANDSVSITNISTVNPGNLTKVEIYWDNVGAPGVFDTDNSPSFGKVYRHLYPNFQSPLTRTFTVRFRAYSGTVCVSDKLQTITVNAAPRVQFNTIPDACLDATPFQITQASEIGNVPGTGVFSGPGVSSTGIFNPASVGAGTYTIKYTYTSTAAGCVDTLSRTITVLDSASANFSYDAIVCQNGAVNFNSALSTIPAASGTITGWTWSFGDPASGAANNSTQQNPSHLFSNWGNFQVSLSVTTSKGCRSTVKTIPVYVNPLPRASFVVPPSACLPSATIAFTNNSTIPDNTQSSFTYLWDFGDPASGPLNSSTNSNPSHIYTTAGPFTVKLQVTSGGGCVDDSTIIVNNIHPQPTGLFTVDKDDICVGQTFTFTDNSDPADGTIVSYSWDMGDGNTRNTRTFTYAYAAGGVYNVTLFITNSHGCKSTVFTKTVTVNAFPIVNAGPDLYILEGGSDTLHPVVTATLPTYLWTPNQYFNSSNTIKDAVVNGVADITYTLTVTGRGGCVATDQVNIKVLKGPEIPNIFSPNGDGIHDTWQIKYLDTYPGGTVEIFNRYGQRIFHSTGYGVPWDGTVNGKPVPMGTYYYIVNPKNGRQIMSGYVDVIR